MLESRTPKKTAHKHAPVEHKQRMFVLVTVNGTPARFTAFPNKNKRDVVDIILHQQLKHSKVTTTTVCKTKYCTHTCRKHTIDAINIRKQNRRQVQAQL